jgi:nitrite reductase/ring-hydroxylating ferredoxin subunit
MSQELISSENLSDERVTAESVAEAIPTQVTSAQKQAYRVAPLAEFPPGSHRVVKVGRREIGIFNVDGTFYALPNLCTHQLGPLCKGKVSGTVICTRETKWKLQWGFDGEIVTCPWHGMEYHIPTGKCLAFPEIRLRSYEVWVEDEQVMVRL